MPRSRAKPDTSSRIGSAVSSRREKAARRKAVKHPAPQSNLGDPNASTAVPQVDNSTLKAWAAKCQPPADLASQPEERPW